MARRLMSAAASMEDPAIAQRLRWHAFHILHSDCDQPAGPEADEHFLLWDAVRAVANCAT